MKRRARIIAPALFVLSMVIPFSSAHAQAGTLDTTFGKGGVAATTLTTASASNGITPYAVSLQSNGEILVLVNVVDGASTTTDVLRYTTSGVLDTTFGKEGIAVLPTTLSEMESMALQSNGQILIAGIFNSSANGSVYGIERLNTNGAADTTFGKDGLAEAVLSGPGPELTLLIETDGDIVLGGQLEPTGRKEPFTTSLARFTSSGALDSTFGSGGIVNVAAVGGCTALAELSTGEIQVVNGEAIAQFTPSGSLESTVTGGTVVASAGSQGPSAPSVFQANGDYLYAAPLFVGEESRGHNASVEVFRFTGTGAADSTFADPSFHFAGAGGYGIEALPYGIAVASNGDIVVDGMQITDAQSGMTTVNGLARLTSSGALDTTFGTDGAVTNSDPAGTEGYEEVAIQPNGDIITVGMANSFTQLTVSRYLGN